MFQVVKSFFKRLCMSRGTGIPATKVLVTMCMYYVVKVHIFWEGHKILRNLHQLFDWQNIGQIIGGDFAKFCGVLRIYEHYVSSYAITLLNESNFPCIP